MGFAIRTVKTQIPIPIEVVDIKKDNIANKISTYVDSYDINKFIIPDRYKNKYGIWLIGYDGGDKSYSTDASLLKEIHSIIDTMPIRRSEMAAQTKKCN